MKHNLFTILLILISTIIFSFTSEHQNQDEITITVTSDKPAKFDMSWSGKITKDLKTPYELKVKNTEARFIFKSKDLKSVLTVKASSGTATVTGGWPVVVILIDHGKLTTFGID